MLETRAASLLDLVDNVLNKGVVVNGEVILAIADVDLVYLRLSVLLCAADRVFPVEEGRPRRTRSAGGTRPRARGTIRRFRRR